MSQQPADADRPTDEQILQYEAAIKETEVVVHPLVGRAEPLADLKPEYQEGNPTFCVKIDGLCADYDRFRRCRGDGNCFYRAYAFRLFEYLLLQPAERVQVIADIYRTEHKSTLLTAGFEEFAFVDFYDEFFDLLSSLNDLPGYMLRHDIELASAAGGADPSATERLLAIFRNDIISNSVVVHLRFLASAYLKSNADMYSPFLDDGMTMEIFCAQFVEAMDRYGSRVYLSFVQLRLLTNFFCVLGKRIRST